MPIDKPPDNEVEPHLPTLAQLAEILGFEPNQTLSDIESALLLEFGRLNEFEILRLFEEYSDEANKMCEAKDRRTPQDDLALMVQLAHLRYFKGKFVQLLHDFEDIREILESPDIDGKTYSLVMATIKATEKNVAAWRKANPRVE